ncbi:cation/H(+) antiporter 15-like [Prosopis cineraria]|uniref:cation/H(+) antiporter 15-like n=1 Tax=Prosopis cineraria TaxID=364024 RepID=UPI00240F61EA|nr:cation/H(+) antiporter 15-like [Prosopis cineraria]
MATTKVHHLHKSTKTPTATLCYEVSTSNANRIWKNGAVLEDQGQLLCLQVAYTVFTSNLFYCILKPLRLPRIVAEILAGFTLSPLCLGHTVIGKTLLNPIGVLNIETYANVGLMCYVLLSGLEMNLDTFLRIRKKAISIAIAGIIVPAAIGAGLFAMLRQFYEKSAVESHFREDEKYVIEAYLFWSLALIVTGFPVLARMLTDLKLLNTKLGKITLTTAMISDTCGWFLFVILIPFSSNGGKPVLSVLSTLLFILVCIFVVRPIINRYINYKTDTDTWETSQLAGVLLLGVIVCSYITDAFGTHAIVGAFVYGLILPNGKFADLVMAKVDDCASGIISSLFFFRIGLTVNLLMVAPQKYWPLMALVIVLLFVPKVLSTLLATFFFNASARDGVGIGLLLNTKGVLAVIILNIAWDRKILSVVYFTIMLSAAFLMTILAPIFISVMYNPRKRFEMYKLRTVQKLRPETELRILACVHNVRQAASMVSVLRNCNATRISPMQVFGVRLVEFKGRAATLFATHIEQPSHVGSPSMAMSSLTESESIASAFNVLAELNHAVRVDTTDAMSVYETIHEDIYSLAQQKLTSLVLLPFHKQADVEGGLETTKAVYKDINMNVLRNPPCSVATFLDRGIGSSSRVNMSILTLFVGGPDDREALAVTWRMAGQPGMQLSVVRIVLYGEATDVSLKDEAQWLSSDIMDEEKQKLLDDEYLNSFRLKMVHNNDFIAYSEEEVGSGEELTSLMHEFAKDDYDLIIIGRGNNRNSVVFSNFLEWCDNPELGIIGDIVASSNFGSQSSLLVVQQYESIAIESTRWPRQLPTNSDGS